jgi:hypothetical protein
MWEIFYLSPQYLAAEILGQVLALLLEALELFFVRIIAPAIWSIC